MSLSVTVVIRENPCKSHRAAEALRIALGLSTGPNPLTVILLNDAPLLLTEETDEFVDSEILEKHLPVLKELGIPFLVPAGTHAKYRLDAQFQIRELPLKELSAAIAHSDRVLVF